MRAVYIGRIDGAELARRTRRDLMWQALERALQPYHMAINTFTACLFFALGMAFLWWLSGLEPQWPHLGPLRGTV